ncbi:hypothetical protein ACP_1669 [Acidobacterium capsulatum ATCC 51196]|uniref:Uncharacterized protein n=1 Tax=Acidobacterium capsulatum (strain ATCC 51196 / DSM 11244 / BCRC 80197 / JCM 7670 / NBRC 15755 / NCIMB 13165 / 161) TaxID=240015 RepID=C1F7B3_ACIC5|nr:hypothetical protein ACP_1669 [Acidobacterium capsulatum ATCC 51196]
MEISNADMQPKAWFLLPEYTHKLNGRLTANGQG